MGNLSTQSFLYRVVCYFTHALFQPQSVHLFIRLSHMSASQLINLSLFAFTHPSGCPPLSPTQPFQLGLHSSSCVPVSNKIHSLISILSSDSSLLSNHPFPFCPLLAFPNVSHIVSLSTHNSGSGHIWVKWFLHIDPPRLQTNLIYVKKQNITTELESLQTAKTKPN